MRRILHDALLGSLAIVSAGLELGCARRSAGFSSALAGSAAGHLLLAGLLLVFMRRKRETRPAWLVLMGIPLAALGFQACVQAPALLRSGTSGGAIMVTAGLGAVGAALCVLGVLGLLGPPYR